MSAGRSRLSRSCSLKGRLATQRLIRHGRRLIDENLTCAWLPSERFRYAVFAHRRMGSAVVRNRWKRLCREAIRGNRAVLTRTVAVGFFPSRKLKKATLEQIHDEVSRMFQRINAATA